MFRFTEEALRFKKVFDVLFVFYIWFPNLFKTDEIVNRGDSKEQTFPSILFDYGILIALFKLDYFTFDVLYALLEEEVKFLKSGITTYNGPFRIGRV